ncbi:hypothetical protein ALP66_05708 [Pseudomonas amygdali pv. photiniae]|uniref:Uncharacterized protein n=1 Tax=Pseudomonas amygdali pv. photiniae TaxID=251724 RepID=A0A658K9I6_PSEA0|nr:hypothetical protein ALP66_05708 [Pseudomonas amygdali pv. photiniae]
MFVGHLIFQAQTGQFAGLVVAFALVVVGHLKQWAAAQIALRLQGFDQLFERQVLMGLGLHSRVFDLLQQPGHGGLRIEVGLEHLSVDKEADQPLGFAAGAVGDGHADAYIGLTAVAVQQGLQRRQQQHEQCDALLPRDLFQVVDQRWRQLDRQPRTGVALHDRARMIGGQFQNRLLFAQLLLPVIQLPRLFSGVHPVALPQRVVGVLHVQRDQHHLTALAVAFVQAHQFIDHDRHRPAIGDDVVLGQHQCVLLLAQFEQPDPQQRPVLQIEGLLHFLIDITLDRFASRQLINFERKRRRRMHHLQRLVALLFKRGAQGFVTLDQVFDATP